MEIFKTITLAAAMRTYAESCAASGKSQETVKNYVQPVRQFAAFWGAESSVADFTPEHLMAFKNDRAGQVKITTMAAYLEGLRLFFDFCRDMRYIAENPCVKALNVNPRKLYQVRNLPYEKLLDERDFLQIMTNDAPARMWRASILRNRAILAILLTSGIRGSSLCALTPADLDGEHHTIHIRRAKGGKTGDVLYADCAQIAVESYLESLPCAPAPDAPLFSPPSKPGKPYNRTNLSEAVSAAVASWTGKTDYRSHAMRHSMANILLRNGMRRGDIGELLMHDDDDAPDVTRRYTGSDISRQLKEANDIFNQILQA